MKKLIQLSIIVIIVMWVLYGCKTTYYDDQGRAKPTWTARHFRHVHPHGFYAAGKWIEYKTEIKKETTVKK